MTINEMVVVLVAVIANIDILHNIYKPVTIINVCVYIYIVVLCEGKGYWIFQNCTVNPWMSTFGFSTAWDVGDVLSGAYSQLNNLEVEDVYWTLIWKLKSLNKTCHWQGVFARKRIVVFSLFNFHCDATPKERWFPGFFFGIKFLRPASEASDREKFETEIGDELGMVLMVVRLSPK